MDGMGTKIGAFKEPGTGTQGGPRIPVPKPSRLKNFCAPVDDSGWFRTILAHEKGALENETLFGRSFYGSSTLLLCEGPQWSAGYSGQILENTCYRLICWPDTRKAGRFIWWVRFFLNDRTGIWSDCFWILSKIRPFESWMYPCFLVNIAQIHVVFFLEHLQVALSPITITHSCDVC